MALLITGIKNKISLKQQINTVAMVGGGIWCRRAGGMEGLAGGGGGERGGVG